MDCPGLRMKSLCCTCLSNDRKLSKLCKLADGVNNLYSLLYFDSEAYREGFYKDTTSLLICWECQAIMWRITRFRRQACMAQRQLSCLADRQTDMKLLNPCLSQLSVHHNTTYQTIISETLDMIRDNFIDCGPVTEIKTEVDLDDIPLSELQNSDNDYESEKNILRNPSVNKNCLEKDQVLPKSSSIKKKKKAKLKITKNCTEKDSDKKYFTIMQMSEAEVHDSREKRKLAAAYADAPLNCETCIEGFKNHIELKEHNFDLHVKKDKHSQCNLCLVHVKDSLLSDHRGSHYQKYLCQFCDYVSYIKTDILKHLKAGHSMKNLPIQKKRGQKKTVELLKPGSKPRRNRVMMDKRTPFGYSCPECDKFFDNKNLRWKHVQRHHREGYKCSACGKRFAFKNNLVRHEQLHQGPPPREECTVCHKMIRVDLLKIHARIHSNREKFSCVECEKCFVSRASYENHLKYTQAHAAVDILKYKCTMCDKGYRSRGELRDHVNYQHMGKTQHKCPICGKALATRRCITRHVRRAHDGRKESARDKICQQCGKAFRDKKGLREHEFIHTGERPLSCEICGCTFRQSASLYTHRKRVHKIHPRTRSVLLVEQDEINT